MRRRCARLSPRWRRDCHRDCFRARKEPARRPPGRRRRTRQR
jgi:hypothetical protein